MSSKESDTAELYYRDDIAEVTGDFDSTIHYDDQISFFDIADFIFIIIADGISQCDSGRIASTIITHHLRSQLLENEKKIKKCQTEGSLNRIIEDSIFKAAEEFKKITDNMTKELISSYNLIIEYTKCKKELINNLYAIKSNSNTLNKYFQHVSSNPLNTANSDIIKEMFQACKNIDEQYKKNENLRHALEKLKESISRRKKNDMNINMSKFISDAIEIINELISKRNSDKFSMSEIEMMVKNIDEPISSKEDVILYDNIKAQLDNSTILAVIDSLRNKKRETNIENLQKHIIGQIFKKIKEAINQNKKLTFQFETTLTVLAICPPTENAPPKLVSMALGDSEIYIASTKNNIWKQHYLQPTASMVNDFISNEGKLIHGTVETISRNLNIDDVVIAATDGAKPRYTTPGGQSGMLFLNKLTNHINNHGTIKDFPSDWIDYLKEKNVLTDDASLVLIRILEPQKRGKNSMFRKVSTSIDKTIRSSARM